MSKTFQKLVLGALSVMTAKETSAALLGLYSRYIAYSISNEFARKFTFTLIVTFVGALLAIKLSQVYANAKINIEEKVERFPLSQLRLNLLWYAKIQQFINLAEMVLSLVIAMAWAGSIIEFVEHTSGDKVSATIQYWICVALVTGMLSFALAISDKYYCIYPKDKRVQHLYENSTAKTVFTKTIYDSFRFGVGLTWMEAKKSSLPDGGSKWVKNGGILRVEVLWLNVILSIVGSSVLGHFFHVFHLKNVYKIWYYKFIE